MISLCGGVEFARTSKIKKISRIYHVLLRDKTIEYSYNASGLRVSKTTNGSTATHIWDGSNIAVELDNAGAVKAIYIRGINLIYTEDGTGTKRYFLFNAHGDVVQLTGNTGTLIKAYDYDAFGNEASSDPADTNPFRYCGEYFDKETGTINLRARYYDPGIGRFISEDSVWGKDNDPLSLNLYTYCANNPINFLDASGNTFQDVCLGMAQAIDKSVMDGFVGWLFDKILGIDVNSPFQYTSEYDYYLGRVIGDSISMAYGLGMSANGIFKIISSVSAGAAITVGSGGTLAIGGVAVSVVGVAVGSAEVTIGAGIVFAAASNFTNDLSKLQNIANYGSEGTSKASVQVKDLKRLPDNKVKHLGGEGYTQPTKAKTGKSKTDLYWNPKTGDVYSIPKSGGTPEYVDTIPTGR